MEVVVEVPRGAFVKPRADGTIDFISPVPCPFNYGRIAGEEGGDGDPLDVILLGPRRERDARGHYPVRGVVRFVDDGRRDDKVVCAPGSVRRRDLGGLYAFFALYTVFKLALNAGRGRFGRTAFLGIEVGAPDGSVP